MTAPIGVFDSGHGGLTILRGLEAALPDEHYLYLGDHAAAPYGHRTPAEIYARTQGAIELLFALGCRLVVLACNTAAAVALRRLQQGWMAERHPERRVLSVIVPVVERLAGVPWSVEQAPPPPWPPATTVALFATPRTVETGTYPAEVTRRAPWIAVTSQACPGLAGAIEMGAPDAELRHLVRAACAQLLDRAGPTAPASAILGCTHYPLVERHFAEALPGIALLSQPALVGASLADYLRRRPDYHAGPGETRFLTTGDADFVTPLAAQFLGRPVRFQAIRA